MKLLYAIIRSEDEFDVMAALMKNGFFVTKIATTGGFLRRGNTTLMIGTDEVDRCVGIVKDKCGSRQKITVHTPYLSASGIGCSTVPVQIEVGGATVFVLNVEQFEKF